MTAPSLAAARRHRVREVDFRRPSKFTRDQVRHLERAHENFCRSVSSRLSAELRADVQFQLTGSDQLPYGTVMAEEAPRNAVVAVLDLQPQGTQIALTLDLGFAHAVITRLLGGIDAPPTEHESLTELETAVVGVAVGALVDTLSASWMDLAEVRLELAGMAHSPAVVELVPPSEPALMLNIGAKVAGTTYGVMLCIPHRSVATVLGAFDRHFGFDDEAELAPGTMERAVGVVDVELRAEVAATHVPVSDVLRLRAGDTIRLGRRAEEGCVLHVDEVPVYRVAPGRNGRVRAVQITGALTEPLPAA